MKISFQDPVVKRLVQAAFHGAKTRRPVEVKTRLSYHCADYWDGGSRTYTCFVQLDTMQAVSSEALPMQARATMGNPFGLPISAGDIPMQPGYAVVEHVIFCGKDVGYRIVLHPDNLSKLLPEGTVP